MSLRGIKLVTFDATNTLLKFRIPPWEYYAAVARNYGYNGDVKDLKLRLLSSFKNMSNDHPNFGRHTIAWEEWWRQVVKSTFAGLLPDEKRADVVGNILIEEFKTTKCWCLADGSEKLLSSLRGRGIVVGVISNFDPRLHNILENVSIVQKLDFILTSYEAGFSKPDDRIFKHAMDRCRVEPSECMHVGDDLEKDYEGARAAGWHAVMINGNVTEKPPAPDHVFKDLEVLGSAIQGNELKL